MARIDISLMAVQQLDHFNLVRQIQPALAELQPIWPIPHNYLQQSHVRIMTCTAGNEQAMYDCKYLLKLCSKVIGT